MKTIKPIELTDDDKLVLYARLMTEVVEVPNASMGSPCWVVGGWSDGKGFRKTTLRGRGLYKHRVMYTILVGDIPQGLVIDHKCRCRSCIHPAHHEPVTVEVNTARGNAKLFYPQQKAVSP